MTDNDEKKVSDSKAVKTSVPNYNIRFINEEISRRRAIGTGVAVAGALVGGLVIGGAAGYLGRGSSTSTSVSTSTVTSTVTQSPTSSSSSTSSASTSIGSQVTANIIWSHGPAYTGIAPAYNALLAQDGYPDLTLVSDVNTNETGFIAELGTSAAPDMQEYNPGYDWRQFVQQGLVRDLTAVWDGSMFGYDHRPDFDASVVSQNTCNGVIGAAYRQLTHAGFIYSQAAMKNAGIATTQSTYDGLSYTGVTWPNTIDDLASMLQQLAEGGVANPWVVSGNGPPPEGWYSFRVYEAFYGYLNGYTAWNGLVAPTTLTGAPAYNDTESLSALSQWSQWISDGYFGANPSSNLSLDVHTNGPQLMTSGAFGLSMMVIEGTGASWWSDASTLYGSMLFPNPNYETNGYVANEVSCAGSPGGDTANYEWINTYLSVPGVNVFQQYSGEWPGCLQSNVQQYLTSYGSTDPNEQLYYNAELFQHVQQDNWTTPGLDPSGGWPTACVWESSALQQMLAGSTTSASIDTTSIADSLQAVNVSSWTTTFGSATATAPSCGSTSATSSST